LKSRALNITSPRSQENLTPEYRENPLISGSKISPKELPMLKSTALSIWEGRFKSCLVDSEHYLFALYKYIEMNPVRAGMVMEPADYKWSSYAHNALGKADKLISEHPLYKALGDDSQQRYKN